MKLYNKRSRALMITWACSSLNSFDNLAVFMASNTLRFNHRVQALQASKRSNVTSGRRQRGPSHGLQGDANSQRKSGTRATRSFRHSQVQKMREKGAAAEVRVLAQDLPEVVIAQEYPPTPADEPMHYEPMGYPGGGSSFEWQDLGSDDGYEEEEEEEAEVEKAARKVWVEYWDFRTKRQRTDASNKNWEEQAEGMVDAYMDWSLRMTTGEALPPCDKPALWIDVVDVFG